MKGTALGIFLLISVTASAQYVGIGTNNPEAKLHVDSGDVYFGGMMGPETKKFIYLHGKSAIQSGFGQPGYWHPDSTGEGSLNVGNFNKVKGNHAVAIGRLGVASGDYSIAMGYRNESTATASTAIGYFNKASGPYSLASGYLSKADGVLSTAMGMSAEAGGTYAFAIGTNVKADSYGEIATGIFNTESTPLSINSFQLNDRLFVIGNGTNASNRSDALMIKKNGNVGIGVDAENSLSYANKLKVAGHTSIEGRLAVGLRAANYQLHVDAGAGVFAGMQLTNDSTGRTNSDGLLLGIQHQGNSSTNKYGLLSLRENSPLYIATNNAHVLSISSSGKLGIGLGSFGLANEDLVLAHGASLAGTITNGFKLLNKGPNNHDWILYTVNSTGNLSLYFNGNPTAKGSFSASDGAYVNASSRNLKTDIQALDDNMTSKLMQLQPVSYRYKADIARRTTLGLIAEDVAAVFPELTQRVGEGETLGINYAGFSVVAIKAIQELNREINTLRAELEDIRRRLK